MQKAKKMKGLDQSTEQEPQHEFGFCLENCKHTIKHHQNR
jgi:hypothetical protein